MARLDPHSYADDAQARTSSIDWQARLDFSNRRIDGSAVLALERPVAGPFDLDTRGIEVGRVTDGAGEALPFEQGPADPVLGSRLRILLRPDTARVSIAYVTAPGASALQWLDAAQTAGGRQPFLFSQCQAIHARSVLPVQDTPRLRITYRARLTVPRALRVVMAAQPLGRTVEGDLAHETFEMPQPIPPYLLAFAAGDLASRDLSPRSRVWAEPEVIESAAREFADVEAMMAAAERLFGPYDWERFDLLTMPPSFPYGGMENPRLTFLTPTLLAGDRSLVNVVAHELAHSWTGNLVTNANAEHFWLNEGFTVWAERRIHEAIEGPELAELHAALGRRALERDLALFRDRPALTRLRTHLEGVDPDDSFSTVPYEKGYLLLRALEEAVGRMAWDAFVQRYLAAFRFGTVTTEEFTGFCELHLPGALARVDARSYLDEPGIPLPAPRPRSARLERVEALAGKVAGEADAAGWTPAEWQLYLELFDPRATPLADLEALERTFGLTGSRNAEVLAAWLALAIPVGFGPAIDRALAFVGEVGRMKYLKPLYTALASRADTREAARRAFERFAPGYHPIAREVVARILGRS